MGGRRKIGLFLYAPRQWGGVFSYCQTMVDAVATLPSSRFDVVVGYADPVWLPCLNDYDLRKVYVPLGIWKTTAGRIIGLHDRLRPYWHAVGRTLNAGIRALHRERCDLWIFPSQEPLTYQAGVPALGTIHDLMHRYERRFPEYAARGKYYYREHHYKAMCRESRGILVNSELGKYHVYESYGMDLSRIHILPEVAPRHIVRAPHANGDETSSRLPQKFLFYPAQFWEHKNHKTLIRAAAALRERLPTLELVFVGQPKNAYRSTVQLVEELGLQRRVHFLGYVPDAAMPELYRLARAMIMPTLGGVTAIPPLEAFATGCPVAISDVYGMATQAGDAALVFDPESVTEIAETMYRLWTDDALCDQLREQGRRFAAVWGAPQFNERLLEIVDLVTASSRPRMVSEDGIGEE